MAKYLNSAGVTYLWKKIKALLTNPFKVNGSSGNYTDIKGGSVATGNADGDQTIIDNGGVIISGGALTIYEDTSKGGQSVAIDYTEAARLKKLKNYTLPAANGTTLGGVKSGGDVTIANGTITVNDDSHNHTIANVDGLQAALNAKAPLASPTFTGTPKAPTAAAGTNTTQIATTAFVQAAVESKIAAADALRFKGTLGTGGTITALPASHKVGDSYKVITAGTYAGQKCEVGDMVVCTTTGTTATDGHWTVIQANVDGAVTGPASAVVGHVATFNRTTGKEIKDSGFTIGKSVPADAKFTDTVYTHPAGSAASKAVGLYKISTDAQSHVKSATAVTKADITALGIPAQDTTYGLASETANGLMSKEDKHTLLTMPLLFDGELSATITPLTQTAADPDAVYWSTTLNAFVAKKGDNYYSAWGSNDYYKGSNLNYAACRFFVKARKSTATAGAGDTLATIYAKVLQKGALTASEYKATLIAVGAIYRNATTGNNGLMTTAMVSKLNGIATGATADSAMSEADIDAAIAAAS